MTYQAMKLRKAELALYNELEAWARKYAATLHSATLDRIIDELDAVRKDHRRASAHYRKEVVK